MGKSCIRFKKTDDLALDVIGEAIKRVPAKKYMDWYQSFLDSRGIKPKKSKPKLSPAVKSAASKSKATKIKVK
jgi:hypothetical protein